MPEQANWRFCKNCHAMFFGGYGGGKCPSEGGHAAQGLDFVLPHSASSLVDAQDKWRFCQKCNAMFFAGYGGGQCPAGGSHSAQGVIFALPYEAQKAKAGQKGWRFCQKCHALFFGGYGGGRCPAGGTHSAQGLSFVLPYKGAAAPSGGSSAGTNTRKYTENANEVATNRTTPTPADVVTMLLAAWPDLTQQGARTLTAQFMGETGGGRYCFNWNLGNVKASAHEPHMYLANTWECHSQSEADNDVERGGGLARIATAEEISQHGWRCPNVVVVFSPPHPTSRFKAYGSLAEGAQRWIGHQWDPLESTCRHASLSIL